MTLTCAETARFVGVSRARVYQRVTMTHLGGSGGTRPLTHRKLAKRSQRGTDRFGRPVRVLVTIPYSVALEWRSERIARGLEVGATPRLRPEERES